MIDLGDPYTKRPIIEALQRVRHDVTQYFGTLPTDIFWAQPQQSWSPAEHLHHLLKSARPVVLGMNLPRPILRLLFGNAERISRRYADVRKTYRTKLAGGFKSPWLFEPKRPHFSEANPELQRDKLLQQWEKLCDDLISSLEKWQENDLDRYRLPHPSLGKISVREMLLFTLYHNIHHIKSVQMRLENQRVPVA